MADIKIKNQQKGTIKTLNKAKITTERIKDNIVYIKGKIEEDNQLSDKSTAEYASNKVTNAINDIANDGIYRFNKYGKINTMKTKENLYIAQKKIGIYRSNQKIKKRIRHINKVSKKLSKAPKVAVRTVRNTGKTAIKTTGKTLKTARTTIKATLQTTKRVIQMLKLAIKATLTAIKLAIAGTKALITAIIAGGWVAVVVIIVICLIAMLCSSIFGIFFSSEINSSNIKPMNSVVSQLNTEFINKLTEIKNNSIYDEYDIKSNRAEWKDILAIYVVKISNGNDNTDVMILTDEKVEILKSIFWDMNTITSSIENITKQVTTTDENGNIKTEDVPQTILHIVISSKNINEMIKIYDFNDKQKLQISELLNEEYASLWNSVIYGTSVGDSNIVAIAKEQVGNIGGETFWRWYGFDSHVEWCACFVSWCANKCGYIEKGIIPKFAACQSEGVEWFKACELWKERGYFPKSGDIIFFDWESDGSANHVGIVEYVENEKVYTIEGNSNDICKQNEYTIDSNDILGYGTPIY